MAAIVANKVKRLRKQRDAESQLNVRITAAVGNVQNTGNRRRSDLGFEDSGEQSPSSLLDKRSLIHRQVKLHHRNEDVIDHQ